MFNPVGSNLGDVSQRVDAQENPSSLQQLGARPLQQGPHPLTRAMSAPLSASYHQALPSAGQRLLRQSVTVVHKHEDAPAAADPEVESPVRRYVHAHQRIIDGLATGSLLRPRSLSALSQQQLQRALGPEQNDHHQEVGPAPLLRVRSFSALSQQHQQSAVQHEQNGHPQEGGPAEQPLLDQRNLVMPPEQIPAAIAPRQEVHRRAPAIWSWTRVQAVRQYVAAHPRIVVRQSALVVAALGTAGSAISLAAGATFVGALMGSVSATAAAVHTLVEPEAPAPQAGVQPGQRA